MFYKFSKKGVFLCVVWVDDDLFTGDLEMQKDFVAALGASFETTVRDVADTHLAIQIVKTCIGGACRCIRQTISTSCSIGSR